MTPSKSGRRYKQLIIWTCFALFLVMSGVGILYLYAVKKDFYFKEINELVSEKAGYSLEKTGPLQFSLFPRPMLTATDLKIINPSVDENNLIARVGQASLILHWIPLLRMELDIDAQLAAPRVTLTVDIEGTENWMTEELKTITGGLPFDLLRIDTSETELLYKNQQKNEILGLDLLQFDIDLAGGGGGARIETAGRLGKIRFFIIGDVNHQAADNRLQVNLDFGAGKAREARIDAIRAPSVSWWIQQNAILFPMQGAIKGEVAIEQRAPAGELGFDIATASMDEFLHLAGDIVEVRPGIGPIRAAGHLLLTGSDIDIKDLAVKIERKELNLRVGGSISNLLSDIEAKLEFNGQTEDLNGFITLDSMTADLPDDLLRYPLPADVSASIKADKDTLIIGDIDAALQWNELSARLTGEMSLNGADLGMNARIAADAPNSREVFQLLGIEAPDSREPGPMKLAASVTGDGQRFTISEARTELDGGRYRSTLEGDLDLAGDVPEIDLKARVEIEDAVGIRKYLRKLPNTMLDKLSVTLHTDAKGPISNFALSDLEILMARPERELLVSGDVSGLPRDPRAGVDFRFTMREPLELQQYFPKLGPLQLVSPLDLAGKLSYADQKLYVSNLMLQAEETDVEGGMKFDFSVDPPQTYIVMASRRLMTKLVVPDPDAASDTLDEGNMQTTIDPELQQEELPKPDSNQGPGELFRAFTNGIEINSDWVKDLNLYFSFSAERANLGQYDFEDLYLTIDAREGVFTLAEYEVTLADQPMSIRGSIDTNTDPPSYHFAGQMEGESLETLLNLEDGIFTGGELGGEFDLQSQGDTLGSMIRHLNGQALVTMGSLKIASNALNIASTDILHSMLSGITKSKEEKRSTEYQCGILGVDVKRGIALIDKSFTLQAKDYNLAGKGKIDLNTGYVDLAAQPKAKKGLGLSLSTLVGGFRVKGHIATPKFGLGGGGLLTAAIAGYALTPTIAAAAATNPATATILATGFLAKGIFDRMTASGYSCKNTLKRIHRRRLREIIPRNSRSGKMTF